MKKLPAILKNKQQEDSSLCSEWQEKERSEGQEERPDKRRSRMTGEETHGRREKKQGNREEKSNGGRREDKKPAPREIKILVYVCIRLIFYKI